MSMADIQTYLIPLIIFSILTWKVSRVMRARRQVPQLMDMGAIVIDVRTPDEFRQGSRPGSINIPLDQLQSRIGELNPTKPVVLCCASGVRSGRAESLLRRSGFSQVVNAGSWTGF